MRFARYSLLGLAAHVLAISDSYELKNDQTLQTCAYVVKSHRWLFNEHLESEIKVVLPDQAGSDADFDIDMIAMSGSDLQNARVPHMPAVKVCDESASDLQYCQYKETADEQAKLPSVDEFVEQKKNKFPVEKKTLKTGNAKDFVYKVDKTSVYCVLFRANGIPEKEDGKTGTYQVVVDWQQSFGRILVSDWRYMWLCWNMMLAYIGFEAVYFAFLQKAITGDAANTVLVRSLRNRKYTFQYRVLFYAGANVLLFMVHGTNYAYLNKHGYTFSGFAMAVISFAMLMLDTMLTVWVMYNLMVLTMGVYFKLRQPDENPESQTQTASVRRKKCIGARAICAVMFVELLIYDMESSSIFSIVGGKTDQLDNMIFAEMVVLFTVFGIWGLLTYRNTVNRAIASRLILTIVLLFVVFVYEFILRGSIINDYVGEKFLTIVNATSYTYMFEFLVAVLIGIIWMRVTFENNEMTIK